MGLSLARDLVAYDEPTLERALRLAKSKHDPSHDARCSRSRCARCAASRAAARAPHHGSGRDVSGDLERRTRETVIVPHAQVERSPMLAQGAANWTARRTFTPLADIGHGPAAGSSVHNAGIAQGRLSLSSLKAFTSRHRTAGYRQRGDRKPDCRVRFKQANAIQTGGASE